MTIIQKRIRLDETPQKIFNSTEFSKFRWIDIIVETSDDEKLGNAKSWQNVFIGPSEVPYIPLINAGSSYSYPYIQGRVRDFSAYYAKYHATGVITDDKKPYLIITGEY